jgi:hypothetical protein
MAEVEQDSARSVWAENTRSHSNGSCLLGESLLYRSAYYEPKRW